MDEAMDAIVSCIEAADGGLLASDVIRKLRPEPGLAETNIRRAIWSLISSRRVALDDDRRLVMAPHAG